MKSYGENLSTLGLTTTLEEKTNLSNYIKSCDLAKRNLRSVTDSFDNCVAQKEGISPTEVVVVAAMTFVVGAIVGRSLK